MRPTKENEAPWPRLMLMDRRLAVGGLFLLNQENKRTSLAFAGTSKRVLLIPP